MWKLIRLEYKKNKTEKYLMKAGIILALFLIFFFAFTYMGIAVIGDSGAVETDMYGRLSEVVTGFVEIVYIVLAASMYASFIIESYQNKSMNLMFTYPIKRSKIVLATTMSLIALRMGIWRKSTRVAIGVSGLLILIKKGNIGGFSVRSIGWVPFALAALAILMTAIYLWNVNRKDVEV